MNKSTILHLSRNKTGNNRNINRFKCNTETRIKDDVPASRWQGYGQFNKNGYVFSLIISLTFCLVGTDTAWARQIASYASVTSHVKDNFNCGPVIQLTFKGSAPSSFSGQMRDASFLIYSSFGLGLMSGNNGTIPQ